MFTFGSLIQLKSSFCERVALDPKVLIFTYHQCAYKQVQDRFKSGLGRINSRRQWLHLDFYCIGSYKSFSSRHNFPIIYLFYFVLVHLNRLAGGTIFQLFIYLIFRTFLKDVEEGGK